MLPPQGMFPRGISVESRPQGFHPKASRRTIRDIRMSHVSRCPYRDFPRGLVMTASSSRNLCVSSYDFRCAGTTPKMRNHDRGYPARGIEESFLARGYEEWTLWLADKALQHVPRRESGSTKDRDHYLCSMR